MHPDPRGHRRRALPRGVRRGADRRRGRRRRWCAGGSLSPPEAGAPEPPKGRGRPEKRERSTGRSELSRNPTFAEISPEVGVLDQEAFDRAMDADPDAAMTLLVEMGKATDERLRAAARALARRIVLDVARRGSARRPGVHRLRAVRADHGGELDLDASLPAVVEARAGGHAPHAEDLVARGWARPDLAVCLLVDASGSMNGARLAAAALTAGACTWRAPADHAVLSFSRETTLVRDMASDRSAGAVVDAVLALRGHGVTALATALRAAAEQLSRSRAARKVVVLLSDCRATDDEDPVPTAVRLPELVVIAPAQDTDAVEDLARRTGARWGALSGPADAPAVLARLLGP